jgi:large subunit ribosomal protein L4
LLVLGEKNSNISLSSRNLKRSKVILADELNTYDVLNAESIVLLESSVKKLEELFG